ncbi:ABC transporter permease [Paenibacillus antibioticophila]|uniref:ABC transporter permease n=1 Tax=Paenibacillus antibioticophila TaxID=1274374 RepID=UPI000B18DB19|nr:ABC transporter permease [Paenibacillus antibioticophila]
MIKVNNKKAISRLSWKSLRANRNRNLIAIMAIMLTTVLFTALFTIAFSINHSYQQANFRQVGGYSHGGFKYLTEQQFEELKDDPMIRDYGLRRFVGMPSEPPFNKAHVEVSYSDATEAKWMFAEPVEGRFPQEGTREAATDTRVLSLLGVEPKLGAEFTMTFEVDGKETTETFLLSGWWEYDEAVIASHVFIPESRVEEIFERLDTQGVDGITGTYHLDMMLGSSLHIERDLNTILERHGYQSNTKAEGNYVAIGVNWGYTGAQLADSLDPMTAITIILLLIIIIITGYLIIYNVFRISVTSDIRFYGLLKTIGASGRQLRRIIRRQALLLSAAGIPLGLVIGYVVGVLLTPAVLDQLNGVSRDSLTANPLIFICGAVFSLVTVMLSCARPGRLAARVSPVEAVRYTESSSLRKAARKGKTKVSLWLMARANLDRSRSKTIITVISLSLAVVLLNLAVTFTNGFDMNKYLANKVADFIVADGNYFQVAGQFWNEDMEVSEDVISEIHKQPGIENAGRIYANTTSVLEFVSEEFYRSKWEIWNDKAALDMMVERKDRLPDGRLADQVQLYGMERTPLDKLTLLDGDISKLYEAGSKYVAAVYSYDDYGNPVMSSHWAKLGDVITLRYVKEYEYYNRNTGEIYSEGNIPQDEPVDARAIKYEDKEYEIAALVGVPHTISFRHYGADEFVLNAETFVQDSGTDSIMLYAFDTTDEAEASMEAFLSDYTTTTQTSYDYESKQTYAEEFEGFRSMFLLLGGVLCGVIGLVGILNFLNAVLTGILTRKREFAVLQSIGMTGRQLKGMLVWEGLLYTLGAVGLSLVISVLTAPLVDPALSGMFWFFTYRFTLIPVLGIAPVFALLGICLPLLVYRITARQTLVERLRDIEG